MWSRTGSNPVSSQPKYQVRIHFHGLAHQSLLMLLPPHHSLTGPNAALSPYEWVSPFSTSRVAFSRYALSGEKLVLKERLEILTGF